MRLADIGTHSTAAALRPCPTAQKTKGDIFMKKTISVLLALIAILSLSACGGKNGADKTDAPSTTAESHLKLSTQSAADTIEGLNLTPYDLQQANSITNLLSVYKSVSVVTQTDDGVYTEGFFLKSGQPAYISNWKFDNGSTLCKGWYEGYDFSSDDGRIVARLDINTMAEDPSFTLDDRLSCFFEDVTVQLADKSADSYIFSTDNAEHTCQGTVTVDKETLAIQKLSLDYTSGESSELRVNYNAFVEGIDMLDGWSGDFKTVTVVSNIALENGESNVTVRKRVPVDWELLPYDYRETVLYLDADSTVEYQYPGPGKDYTVYITNVMG